MTPWTKTWSEVWLCMGEPYRLTSTVNSHTAGSCVTVHRWMKLPTNSIMNIVGNHLRAQFLRVGDMCVYDDQERVFKEVSKVRITEVAQDLVMQALQKHTRYLPNRARAVPLYCIPQIKVFKGGKAHLFPLPPLPELSVEAEPRRANRMEQGSRIVSISVQVRAPGFFGCAVPCIV